jgi:ferritin-like metal-binding protein YciE
MQSVIAKEYSNEAGELRGLFEKQLMELYWAEGIMQNMLKGIIVQSSSKDLVSLLERHLQQTTTHAERLVNIFIAIGVPVQELPYESIKCLIKEADDFIKLSRQGVVRDAGIIALLQKIKHYEIACYGTMRAYAIALREEEVVLLLEQTLEEEKTADALLSAIAESHINTEAADKEI